MPASPVLGGLGDEPSGAALQPEESQPPSGRRIRAFRQELGLAPPPAGLSALSPIHTALLPEPHDLDPYLPIGIRLGSFLLFPELEVGADLTNNVLDTISTQAPTWDRSSSRECGSIPTGAGIP